MNNKKIAYIIYAALVVVAIILATAYYINNRTPKVTAPKVIPQTQVADPAALAQAIKITPKEATEVVAEIPKAAPVATYVVAAPDVETAAAETVKAIEKKDAALPVVVAEKSDHTVVTPNVEAQKVDVYKINLNKGHKLKAGVTVIEDKVYPTLGYQAGRVEGLVQLDGAKIKGATVMYTVVQW